MNAARLFERLLRYIACDSESGDEGAFCTLLEAELRCLKLPVFRDGAGVLCGSNGGNLYASLPGVGEPILFCAHMDTVSPGKGIYPVLDEDRVLYSGGDTILGADDKSGIAAVMEMLETLLESGLCHRPIEVLFTICEENGLRGARHADYSRLRSRQAVVLDSGRPHVIINRTPIHESWHVRISGKSAHAGVAPEKGIHTLKAAAAAVAEIPCGRVDEATMMNVGSFLSPGSTNLVPAEANFDLEIRSHEEARVQYWSNEIASALERACVSMGAHHTVTKERHTGLLYVPEDSKLIRDLVDAYRELGLEAVLARGFGGSDASLLFSHGIEAVNIGTGMRNIHSLEESIPMSDLERVTKLIFKLVQTG